MNEKKLSSFIIISLGMIFLLFMLSFCQTEGGNRLSGKTVSHKYSKDSEVNKILSKIKAESPGKDNQANDFTLPNVKGKKVSLKDYRGKVVFLNFWVTWCSKCRNEMPAMEKLYQKMKGKDFVMLAVSFDQAKDSVSAFVELLGMTFPVLLDPIKKVTRAYNVRRTPTTFIIDKDGRILARVVGERHWDSKDSIKLFMILSNGRIAQIKH